MKKFLNTSLVFILPLFAIFVVGVFLPTTPKASKSLLMANIKKNSLLKHTTSPRIIFIGGSNVSFGLNSQKIKDELGLNPINTGIHFEIGIKFMIDNTLDYIKKGDIVVLVPEYFHYYKSLNYGSEELMRTVFDVSLTNINKFNFIQFANIFPFLPRYGITKFKPSEYFKAKIDVVYSVDSYNEFGDTYVHWEMKNLKFEAFGTLTGAFNSEVIPYFEKFNEEVKRRGAVLLVSFPCFQDQSYHNSKSQIKKIEQQLLRSKLNIIGNSERYKMHDSLFFNTAYHPNKMGVEIRTNNMILDIKNGLSKIQVRGSNQ